MQPSKKLFENKAGDETQESLGTVASQAVAVKKVETQSALVQKNRNQRGSGNAAGGLGALLILGLVVAGVLWIFGCNFGSVSEGTVTYDDCRSIVTLQPGSWRTYFGQFTCTYSKTQSGQIMDGECVKVVNDSSFLSSSHTCATAYIYQAPQANVCTDPTYPYLGYDDKCYSIKQY
jgi:hypothetical protein